MRENFIDLPLIMLLCVFFVLPILVVLLQPFIDKFSNWVEDLIGRYYDFLGYQVEEDEPEKV